MVSSELPRVQVLTAAVLFGTTGTALALGPSGTTPVGVGAGRIVVGALGLWAAVLWLERTRGSDSADDGARGQAVAWISGLGVAIYQLSFFAAVELTGVAVGTVVAIGSGPAAAGLLSRIVNGERLTRAWAGATALACTGVVLLGLGGGDASIDPVGVGLAVVAGCGYALYTVLSKSRLEAGVSPERVMSAAFGRGALLLIPALLLAGAGWIASPGGAALVLYLGVLPTAVAYLLFGRGLSRLGAGETATLTLAEPLTAALLGTVVLDERPGAVGMLGAALVLAGLLVLARPRRGMAVAAEVPG